MARGVYAASAWHNARDPAGLPERQEVRTVKRPEGRAPAPILIVAPDTDLAVPLSWNK